MSEPKTPDTDQIPPQIPPWSCRRWGEEDHDWLSCPSCQKVYETHIEMENDPNQAGILHWDRGNGAACGSRSDAVTEYLTGPTKPTQIVVGGELRLDPRVTCPLCLDVAREAGQKVDIPFHEDPYQHG